MTSWKFTDCETGENFNSYEAMIRGREKFERDRKKLEVEKHFKALATLPAKALGVYSQPEKTVIIQASCEYKYAEKSHYLTFENEWQDSVIATSHLRDFILKNIPEHPYCGGFFVNNIGLGRALNRLDCVVNCKYMQPMDLDEIKRVYKELVLGDRLKSLKNVNLELDDYYVQNCINILIYAFSPRLDGVVLADFIPYGNYMSPTEWEVINQLRGVGSSTGTIRTY